MGNDSYELLQVVPQESRVASTQTNKNISYGIDDGITFNALTGILVDRPSGLSSALPPTASRLLVCLLDNRNTIVRRLHLSRHVWNDLGIFVEESNINQSIYVIRRALKEIRPDKKFIKTISKIGYCFVDDANVYFLEKNASPTSDRPTQTKDPRRSSPLFFVSGEL